MPLSIPSGLTGHVKLLLKIVNLPLQTVTYVCPCIVSLILNGDQQDATILAYLFIPNQRYTFRMMSSPIIRST